MFKIIAALVSLHGSLRRHPLSRDRLGAAFAAFLVHQIRVRLQGEIIYPWVGDSKLAIRKRMSGAAGNRYTGLLEFQDMGFVLHFLRREDTFFDVGANAGTYTVLASKVCGARSVSFEPDPTTAVHLRRNLEVNGIEDRVEIIGCAVGAERGEVRFSVGLDVLNHIVSDEAARSRVVKLVRLDDYAEHAPVLIKIDVEGYETGVIEGAEEVLGQSSLQALLIENPTPAIIQTLARHGFARAYYDPRGRLLTREPMGLQSGNALFVRDLEWCRDRVRSAQSFSVLGTTL